MHWWLQSYFTEGEDQRYEQIAIGSNHFKEVFKALIVCIIEKSLSSQEGDCPIEASFDERHSERSPLCALKMFFWLAPP